MGEAPADERLYVFGDLIVDPRAHRVLRAGAEVALEPKAYAVLLLLLERAGTIVPRDALLDAVWGHRHVTPAVLNRVIAMLRRALGDDAEHPRWIRTVYGTGYGFIGELRHAAAIAAEPPDPEPQLAPETIAAAASPAVVAAPAVSANPVPPAAPSRAPVVGLALLMLALLAGLLLTQRDVPQVAPASAPVPAAAIDATADIRSNDAASATAVAPLRVAVLPLRAEPDGESAADLAAGLTDGLIEALSRQSRIAVTARESSERVDANDPGAALAALGVDRVVAGRVVLRDDGTVAVDISLHREPGLPAWTQRYQRPRAQVFRLLGPLLDDLRNEALPIGSDASLRALRAASERVQDLYGEASLQMALVTRGHPQTRAEDVLAIVDRVLAEDPTFAPAHTMRASLFTRMGNVGTIDLDTAAREARAAADRAIALDPDLMEGHLAAGFAATMQWRSIEAVGPAQRALELAPNDARALSLMANVLSYTGRVTEGEAFATRSDALNPLLRQAPVRHSWSKVLAGDRDGALAHIDTLERQLGTSSPFVSRTRVLLAFGETGRALAIDRNRVAGEAAIAGFARAATLQVLGESDAARGELDAVAPKLPAMPLYLHLRLREALLVGDAAGFVARLDAASAAPAQSPWREVLRAAGLARTSDRDAALRAFGRVFAEPRHRELLVYSWFATSSGVAYLADWIALRRAAALPHTAELAAHDAFLQAFVDGGVKAPMMAYHRAVSAALHGDVTTANSLLGEAITAGWLDPIALRFDLAWAPYASEAWLIRRQDEIAARVQEQRRIAGLP